MLIYLTLLMLANIVTLNLSMRAVILFMVCVLIFRTKYQANYAFQRSINELHLFFDRVGKRCGGRNFYQKFYKVVVNVFCVSGYNSGKRVIRY